MSIQGYVLVGPTAAGKTAVAHILARQHNLPVISADSMLVYRGMDIGTAKPGMAEREGVTYAGIDLAEPSEDFNVALYLRRTAEQANGWGGPVLVTGGTGLYVRCLLDGLEDVVPPDAEMRARAEAMLAADGPAVLRDELRKVSPETFSQLSDPQNPHRLIRALEHAWSGRIPSRGWKERPPHIVIGLRLASDTLKARIEQRVDRMLENGLLDEARRLREMHPALSATATKAIGYEEAWAVLDGAASVKEARSRICARTRQLAKRQMTWFRHQLMTKWVDVDDGAKPVEVARAVWAKMQEHGTQNILI